MNRIYLIATLVTILITTACGKGKGSGSGGGGAVTPPATPVWDVNAMRGVWVTTAASTALDNRNNIKQVAVNCKAAGINHIFVVVYNNARTMYPSPVMNALIGKPQLERYIGRDPLQEMIEEGHALGIKVHAWFEYGFSSSYSANGGEIVAVRPAWAARDVNGNLVVKNGFDWLNGINPQVQQFMVDLYKEVVTNYAVDGVQGDDRLPAMPTTGGYDAYTTSLYQAENGGANPPGNPIDAGWIQWRARKLNSFVKRLRNEVKAIKPNCMYTMSPSPYPWGLTEYLQDWPTWVDSAWVDAIIPQCYRYDINAYNGTIAQQKQYYRNSAVPFYPGVLLKSGSYVATAGFLSQMVQTNRNNTFKGEVFFFYEGVKDIPSWFNGTYPYIR